MEVGADFRGAELQGMQHCMWRATGHHSRLMGSGTAINLGAGGRALCRLVAEAGNPWEARC